MLVAGNTEVLMNNVKNKEWNTMLYERLGSLKCIEEGQYWCYSNNDDVRLN